MVHVQILNMSHYDRKVHNIIAAVGHVETRTSLILTTAADYEIISDLG